MALVSTQPLTEMSTRDISWGVKAASAWGWQPYHRHVQIVLKSGSFSFLEPSGPVQGSDGIAFFTVPRSRNVYPFFTLQFWCEFLDRKFPRKWSGHMTSLDVIFCVHMFGTVHLPPLPCQCCQYPPCCNDLHHGPNGQWATLANICELS